MRLYAEDLELSQSGFYLGSTAASVCKETHDLIAIIDVRRLKMLPV